MTDPLEHFIYRLRNAHFAEYPFRHVFIEDVFPAWYVAGIQSQLQRATSFESMPEYPHRLFSGELDDQVKALFADPRMGGTVCSVFKVYRNYEAMIRWTRDSKGYSLAPHTDAKEKAVTLLFYMPIERSEGPWGTSLYLPKDRSLKSDGTTHYPQEAFDLIQTFPFKANSMLGILRSDSSWHGVEQITKDIQRDSLFYTLNEKIS